VLSDLLFAVRPGDCFVHPVELIPFCHAARDCYSV
jgi:hypothetical protein